MFAVKRHLDDNLLIRRYLADRGLAALDAQDEAPMRHLAHCAACEARYQTLRAAFEETRAAAATDADAACSEDRLAHQRERIMRRIDALQSGPRVLPFPAAAQQFQVIIAKPHHAGQLQILVGAPLLHGIQHQFPAGAAVIILAHRPSPASLQGEAALTEAHSLPERVRAG